MEMSGKWKKAEKNTSKKNATAVQKKISEFHSAAARLAAKIEEESQKLVNFLIFNGIQSFH